MNLNLGRDEPNLDDEKSLQNVSLNQNPLLVLSAMVAMRTMSLSCHVVTSSIMTLVCIRMSKGRLFQWNCLFNVQILNVRDNWTRMPSKQLREENLICSINMWTFRSSRLGIRPSILCHALGVTVRTFSIIRQLNLI